MIRFCKKCGRELSPEMEFCPTCGTPVSKAVPIRNPQPAASVSENPNPVPTGAGATPPPAQIPAEPVQPQNQPVQVPPAVFPRQTPPAQHPAHGPADGPKKSNTGLIVSLSVGIVVLLAAAAVVLYLYFSGSFGRLSDSKTEPTIETFTTWPTSATNPQDVTLETTEPESTSAPTSAEAGLDPDEPFTVLAVKDAENGELYNYEIPQFQADSPDAIAANAEIASIFAALDPQFQSVETDLIVCAPYYSILIKAYGNSCCDHTVFTLHGDTARLAENGEMVQWAGIASENFVELAKHSAVAFFDSEHSVRPDWMSEADFAQQRELSRSDDYVHENMRMYPSADGTLMLISAIGQVAGPRTYECVYPCLTELPEPPAAEPTESEFSHLRSLKAGDTFSFGRFDQDGNVSNGMEDIEWIVLDVQDGNILALSRYALTSWKYHKHEQHTTWEDSDIRYSLNEIFYHDAFTLEEEQIILSAAVPADGNPRYATDPGAETMDHVFLLSADEVNTYFDSNADRICRATQMAMAQNAYRNDETGGSWWILRTPGADGSRVVSVNSDGSIDYKGGSVDAERGTIRPAIWICP